MSQFKPGEIAILQNCIDPSFNGEECTILHAYTGPYRDRRTGKEAGIIENGYVVRTARGDFGAAKRYQLRKKRPPHREIDTVVSWGDCAWKPVKEVA